ncbi:hypothetical protein Poli38472_000824 [Pythium oligandrum]|uniref:UDENN domain-containing protein n=1 Tax=Pythium oligandrum TaxID=41045 RepID=A0A8K1FIH7_PYTOL|nr:hypothetical protein Poli38472_000824 [Pythium oligandrum]|eukprot:TMW60782.1 hypothetical protein Poli38472_000824 [Pythium oligandrum]
MAKDDDELNLEIDWGDGDSCERENEDDASPQRELSPDKRLEQERLEEQELLEMVNDADEIYTFLTAELQRHSADRRLKDDDVVPQILDIWVTAGQKYALVIKYVDSKLQESPSEQRRRQKTTILERFGSSLYVFAMQLLKSITTIFKYEELFHFNNGRVFKHLKGDLWNGFDESATTFAADLAIESLSLASGKLGLACQELQTLYHTEQQSESLNELLESEDPDASPSSRSTAERYYACLLQRANCLDAYGDVLAHGSHVVDYDLGWALEDEQEHDASSSDTGFRFYVSDTKLTKHSTPGRFYHEAQRIYRYLLTMSSKASAPPSNGWITKLHWYLAKTEFKVATHIPRRCLAEKRLLDNATAHLKKHSHHCQLQSPDEHDQSQQRLEYLRSVVVVREKFFQPETDKPQDDIESSSSTDSSIVPLYRFVLVAVFRDFDNHKLGMLTQEQLTRLNELCRQNPVTDLVMAWLLNNFDSQDSLGLTEKGMLQYLCWLAEANPPAFCDILDILTEKYTETQTSISSTAGSSQERRPTSLRRPVMSPRRQYSSTELGSPRPDPKNCASGIAQCIVILTGKIIQDANGDISQTRTPSEVRLEPVVVDCLPPSAVIPDELSKFCFPDEIFMSSEPLPPKTLDIVLTDITGARHFGTCFHFYEEKDPIDVLALISNSQRGEVSASLPSWISLKDIQQRNIPWRCFIPKSVCILSSAPLFQTFRDCLAHLYRLSISLPPYPVEAFLHDILERIPLPTSGHTVTCFNLGDKSILLSGCPVGSSPFHAKQTDFTLLFQCLSAENILKVYSYVMTEKKIILCARNASILTPVAETLRALLFPFECQVVYIPLLPLVLRTSLRLDIVFCLT